MSVPAARNQSVTAAISQRNDKAWFELDFDLNNARALAEWAKKDSESIGYAPGVAQSLTVLAFLLLDESKLDTALSYCRTALHIVRADDDKTWLPRVYCATGGVYRMFGDTTRCVEYYELQLAAAHEISDTYHEAVAAHDIGFVLDDATYFHRALTLAEAIGYKPLAAAILSNLSVLHQRSGELSLALGYAERALSLAREIHATVWETQSLWSLAIIHARMGHATLANDMLFAFESTSSFSSELMTLKRAQIYDAMLRDGDAADAYKSLLAQPGLSQSNRLFALQALGPIYSRMRLHQEAHDAQRDYEALRLLTQKDQNEGLMRALRAAGADRRRSGYDYRHHDPDRSGAAIPE